MTDWEHSILEFLREQYSPWSTPLNNFLTSNLNIDPASFNHSQKLSQLLKGLQDRNFLVWKSKCSQDVWPLGESSPGKHDGTLSNNDVEAKLTFDGLIYAQNRKITDNQLAIATNQYSLEKKIGFWSIILAAMSVVFIAITTVQPFFEEKPPRLDTINREVQIQSKSLKGIESSLQEINSSIRVLVDSLR